MAALPAYPHLFISTACACNCKQLVSSHPSKKKWFLLCFAPAASASSSSQPAADPPKCQCQPKLHHARVPARPRHRFAGVLAMARRALSPTDGVHKVSRASPLGIEVDKILAFDSWSARLDSTRLVPILSRVELTS